VGAPPPPCPFRPLHPRLNAGWAGGRWVDLRRRVGGEPPVPRPDCPHYPIPPALPARGGRSNNIPGFVPDFGAGLVRFVYTPFGGPVGLNMDGAGIPTPTAAVDHLTITGGATGRTKFWR